MARFQIDDNQWQQGVSNAKLTEGQTIALAPHPESGGSWSWSGPNGFTSNSREITFSKVKATDSGEYVATFTDDSGLESRQVFRIEAATPITPRIRIDGSNWQQGVSDATVGPGATVLLEPQPASGGSWHWTGPTCFTSSSRQVTLTRVEDANSGKYVATFMNEGGVQSRHTFAILVTSPITPWVRIHGQDWKEGVSNAAVAPGGTIILGPQPDKGGTWSWTGPNGFTSDKREVVLSDVTTANAGAYVATFTNDSGAQSQFTFNITVIQ